MNLKDVWPHHQPVFLKAHYIITITYHYQYLLLYDLQEAQGFIKQKLPKIMHSLSIPLGPCRFTGLFFFCVFVVVCLVFFVCFVNQILEEHLTFRNQICISHKRIAHMTKTAYSKHISMIASFQTFSQNKSCFQSRQEFPAAL